MCSAQLALSKLDVFLVFYLCHSDCLDLDLDLELDLGLRGWVGENPARGNSACCGLNRSANGPRFEQQIVVALARL